MEEFCKAIYEDCGRNAADVSHVLCVQNTTESNYGSHSGRIDSDDNCFGYGTRKEESNCLFAHPALVLDASNGLPLGFSSLKIWGRGNTAPGQKIDRRKRALQEKESYRWAESAENTAKYIPSGACKTMVGDRENDIYEVIWRTLESGCDFLIRSSSNRPTTSDGKRLSEIMEEHPLACTYELPIVGRQGRKNRIAMIELGIAIEESQVETGESMIKLIGMTFMAAINCMMLKTALEKQTEHIPAKNVFSDIQLKVMKAVLPSLEPKSERYTKGRNPHAPDTLLWAAWIVAKLGGWNGRMTINDRPSHLVLKRGWERLQTMSWGAELALENVYKD